jgi:hypothetical protein
LRGLDYRAQHSVDFAGAHLDTVAAKTQPDNLLTRGHQRGRNSQPHEGPKLGLHEQRTPQGGHPLPGWRQDSLDIAGLKPGARTQPAHGHARQKASGRGSKGRPAGVARKRGRSGGAGLSLQRCRKIRARQLHRHRAQGMPPQSRARVVQAAHWKKRRTQQKARDEVKRH